VDLRVQLITRFASSRATGNVSWLIVACATISLHDPWEDGDEHIDVEAIRAADSQGWTRGAPVGYGNSRPPQSIFVVGLQ
jgi:hypothetical protein